MQNFVFSSKTDGTPATHRYKWLLNQFLRYWERLLRCQTPSLITNVNFDDMCEFVPGTINSDPSTLADNSKLRLMARQPAQDCGIY